MPRQMPGLSGFWTRLSALLPIYSTIFNDCVLLYAPRKVCVLNKSESAAVLRHVNRLVLDHNLIEESQHQESWTQARRAASKIVKAARKALDETTEVSQQEFMPECLTLYVNNQCNLRCRYCYSQPDATANGSLSERSVREAARFVAGMCAAQNRPFTLAFHGGGEPALHSWQVDRLLNIAQKEADRFGLHPRTYIATNGVVSEETAKWLATRFDLVGVSCDGPPEIQDHNRPGRDGQAKSKYVGRTMSTLKRHGRPFHVRVTVSCEMIDRQAEIVSYLSDRYAPAEIRIEPAYANPSGKGRPEPFQAASFARGFLAAQAEGAIRGIPVTTSITRPNDIYGPYCNVLRRVLNLVPGDIATGCFLDSRPEGIAKRGVETGSFDSTNGVFRLNKERIRSLTIRCSERPVGCDDCICSYQCTYGCPDRCVLDQSGSPPFREGELGSFRCQVNRILLEYSIREAASEAWVCTPQGHCQEVFDAHRMLSVAVYRAGCTCEGSP